MVFTHKQDTTDANRGSGFILSLYGLNGRGRTNETDREKGGITVLWFSRTKAKKEMFCLVYFSLHGAARLNSKHHFIYNIVPDTL